MADADLLAALRAHDDGTPRLFVRADREGRTARMTLNHWHPWLERTKADHIWITLEYVMHLDTLIAALASRPGGRSGPLGPRRS